jgi:hypothetical protein
MNDRREFLKSITAAAALGAVSVSAAGPPSGEPAPTRTGRDDRRYWVSTMATLAGPVLSRLAKRGLKRFMPVETRTGAADRARFTRLEAFGRLLAGISPWLGARRLEAEETALQGHFTDLARLSLEAATDPASPDFMDFADGGQPLVDTAFLAQGLLRAPAALWGPLGARAKSRVVEALKSSRALPVPTDSNWVMFAAMVEAALMTMGEPTVGDRLEGCLRSMLGWYKGDGAYGDGEWFHFDYYNSLVIQPMLLDVLEVLRQRDGRFGPAYGVVLRRARRYAEVQERFVAPDGTFPSVGRSAAYRFGALQLLAQVSLMRELPERVRPAQVRCALTAVIGRMIEAPGTFDADGWLRVGFCGHQPSLGEHYISTGSLYLCSAGLLPLGLPPDDPFWADEPARWTSQRLWSGEDLPEDAAIRDEGPVEIPSLRRAAG